jgi:protease-4
MLKFLLGILCGLVLAGIIGVIFVFSAIRLSERRPTVADNSVLMLRLEGDVPEKPEIEIPLAAFEEHAPPTVRDIWSLMHRAAADSRVKGIVLAPRKLETGWAKLEELRQSVLDFRKSGKPVYAFLRFPTSREYYIASAADRVYASPDDYLDVKGLRVETIYFKRTLDKIGVGVQVEHAGKYKDAGDMLTRTSMSPETKEVLDQVLDQFYGNLSETIASGRKKSAADIRALLDQGPFTGQQALASGLVDALGYEDQVVQDLTSRARAGNLHRTGFREYLRALPPEPSRTRIALVVGQGAITQGSGEEGFGAESGITSGGFIRLLRRVRSDNLIKGVIVRIDSPGGDAIASDDILHEMIELGRAKPTVISMSDYAASGGYYMAVSGDPIIAYPNTLTGSIGVISAKLTLRGLYDKLGISKDILSRGRFSTMDSDYKPMDPIEEAKFREMVDTAYRTFVTRVATGRRRKFEEIEPLAQGRVWLGAQAKQNGLVDELGGLDRAVEMIREKAKLSATEPIALVPYPPKRSLFDVLFTRNEESPVLSLRTHMLLKQIAGEDMWILPALRGGLLALMPYSIRIN